MDNKKIIIILSIILVIMIALGFVLFGSNFTKQDSKINITSNSSLYDGDNVTIHLTDLNGTPIANQIVNVIFVNASGVVKNQTLTTDSNGDASLQLNGLAVGNYTVKVNYNGNENFSACNATQDLGIKEKPSVSSSNSGSGGLFYDPKLNLYYNSAGIVVDPDGNHPMGVGQSYYKLANAPHGMSD